MAAWGWRAAFHRTRLTESLVDGAAPLAEQRATLGDAGYTPMQQLGWIDRVVEQQAHTLAAHEVFMASAVLFLGLDRRDLPPR